MSGFGNNKKNPLNDETSELVDKWIDILNLPDADDISEEVRINLTNVLGELVKEVRKLN